MKGWRITCQCRSEWMLMSANTGPIIRFREIAHEIPTSWSCNGVFSALYVCFHTRRPSALPH
jgi:hypothetical protein